MCQNQTLDLVAIEWRRQELLRGGRVRNYEKNDLRVTHKKYYEIYAINSDKCVGSDRPCWGQPCPSINLNLISREINLIQF